MTFTSHLCDRCKEEIEKANIIDSYPEIDRINYTVNSIYLSPKRWEVFSLLLLRKGLFVTKEEFEDYIFDGYIKTVRMYICTLRKILRNTPFKIISKRMPGNKTVGPVSYSLIYRENNDYNTNTI